MKSRFVPTLALWLVLHACSGAQGAPDAGSPDASLSDAQHFDGAPDAWPDAYLRDAGPRTSLGCSDDWCPLSPAAASRMARFFACEPVQLGWPWNFGEVVFDVQQRTAQTCAFEVVAETEAGVMLYYCELPLPITAWAGLSADLNGAPGMMAQDALAGIEDHCSLVANCRLDNCPLPIVQCWQLGYSYFCSDPP